MAYMSEVQQAPAPRRPSDRPARSRRVPEAHFDPEELSRRLYLVLAEQKEHAERKRKAREASTSTGYNKPSSSSNRRRDGAGRRDGGQASSSTGSHTQHQQPATTDLISELKRCSLNKRRGSKLGLNTTSLTQSGSDPNSASAGEAGASPSEYHHVPSQAARQFARTTTVDVMRDSNQIHTLSKRALKYHLEAGRTTKQGGGETAVNPAELAKVLRYNLAQRDKALERNQFQHSRALEEAVQKVQEREREERAKNPLRDAHTFEGELSRIAPPDYVQQHLHPNKALKRNTIAVPSASRSSAAAGFSADDDLLEDSVRRRSLILMEQPTLEAVTEDVNAQIEEEAARFSAHEHRAVDWTQSDEVPHRRRNSSQGNSRPKLLLAPLLRKADSILGMRGKLGGGGSSTNTASVANNNLNKKGTIASPLTTTTSSSSPGSSSSASGPSAVSTAATSPGQPQQPLSGLGTATAKNPKSPKSPKIGFFAKFKR